jgi:hypothetical protein
MASVADDPHSYLPQLRLPVYSMRRLQTEGRALLLAKLVFFLFRGVFNCKARPQGLRSVLTRNKQRAIQTPTHFERVPCIAFNVLICAL